MRITIPLSEASIDTLRRLASQELRDPRMQAKLILERELRAASNLTADQPQTARPDAVVA